MKNNKGGEIQSMLHLAAADGHGVDHAEIAPPFSNPAQLCVCVCVRVSGLMHFLCPHNPISVWGF